MTAEPVFASLRTRVRPPRLPFALHMTASTAETDALEEAFEALQDDEHRAGERRAQSSS